MGKLASGKLKKLLEVNTRIHSSYADRNALLGCVLESAMRLVECESTSFIALNNDNLLCLVAMFEKGKFETKNVLLDKDVASQAIARKEPVVINAENDECFCDFLGKKVFSLLAVPICTKTKCLGVIELVNKLGGKFFSESDLEIISLMCRNAAIAFENAVLYENARENISVLHGALETNGEFVPVVVKSKVIKDLLGDIEIIAKTNSAVLITGERETGKTLFAEQLHLKSDRAKNGAKKFVKVDCTLPKDVLENVLFGNANIYANANGTPENSESLLERANGGTIFFDEIAELSSDVQLKILYLLQNKEFEKIDSHETVFVDVRIVASTSCDIEAMVKSGAFRSDLYYRLNVVPLFVPPLRARKDDIEILADFFASKFSRETKKNFTSFSCEARKALISHLWHGNVSELKNCIERACILGKPPVINTADLCIAVGGSDLETDAKNFATELKPSSDRSLKNAMTLFKKSYVMRVLDETGWNQTLASKVLDVQRTYVARLLNELHIRDNI